MIFFISRKSQPSHIRTVSLVLLCVMALWNTGTCLELDFRAATGITLMFFVNICYIGICLVPVAILCLGRVILQPDWHPKPVHVLFLVIPLVSIVVVFTNPLHRKFFENFSLYSSEAVYGSYYYFHALYSYGCIAAGIILMFMASARNSGVFSRQTLLIIAGVIFATVPNVLYSFGAGDLPFSISVAAFTVSMPFFIIAFLKYRFITALPITLRQVVDIISDGYLVVDRQSCILSYNQALLNMFPQPVSITLGENLRSFIDRLFQEASYEKFLELQAQAVQQRKTVSVEKHIAGKNTYIRVEITPVMHHHTQAGSIILLKDITQSRLLVDTTIAANRAKSDFLARMSHEMRTPLNAVICLSGLSLDAGRLNEEDTANLENIYNAGETLLRTVNDILDISKIESGKMELVPADYDFSAVINDAVTQNILRIGEKPIEFSLDIGEDLYTHLNGDELRVKQIMSNLLSNAVKYTNEGRVELSVHCRRENDRVWVTVKVSDTGIGFRPEDMDRLFSDYTQFNPETNRKTEGTGLGLSITKKLAGMMDGSVSVESEYKKGSVFTVVFAQKPVTNSLVSAKVMESLRKFSYCDSRRRRNMQLRRIRAPYARVMVVDDNSTNLDVAKGLMKPYGMQIDCMTGGQQAVDAIRAEKYRYNAIFMDHLMSGMDGIEATRLIREIGTEYAKNIPIIALTANAVAGNEEMFLNSGFQAFLSKPIDISQLDAVIRTWIQDAKQEELFAGDQPNWQERRSVSDRRSSMDRRKLYLKLLGLDMKKGLEQFGNNEEVYNDILRTYASDTKPLLKSIEYVSREKLSEYAIIVHGIKGSSRSVFSDTIGDFAETLEKAAKAGDFNYVKRHNRTFLDAAWKLINDLDDMFSAGEEDKPKSRKSRPDRDMLAVLLAACKANDKDGAEGAMTAIKSYDYDIDDGFVAWLGENVEQMNFGKIAAWLSVMID